MSVFYHGKLLGIEKWLQIILMLTIGGLTIAMKSQSENRNASLCSCIGMLCRTASSFVRSRSAMIMLGACTGDSFHVSLVMMVSSDPAPSCPPASASNSPHGPYTIHHVERTWRHHVSKCTFFTNWSESWLSSKLLAHLMSVRNSLSSRYAYQPEQRQWHNIDSQLLELILASIYHEKQFCIETETYISCLERSKFHLIL